MLLIVSIDVAGTVAVDDADDDDDADNDAAAVAIDIAVYADVPVAAANADVLLKRTRHAVLLVAVDVVILFCERRTLTIVLDVVDMLPDGSTCIALALLLPDLLFVLAVFAITCIALLGFIDCDIFYSLILLKNSLIIIQVFPSFLVFTDDDDD